MGVEGEGTWVEPREGEGFGVFEEELEATWVEPLEEEIEEGVGVFEEELEGVEAEPLELEIGEEAVEVFGEELEGIGIEPLELEVVEEGVGVVEEEPVGDIFVHWLFIYLYDSVFLKPGGYIFRHGWAPWIVDRQAVFQNRIRCELRNCCQAL